MNEDNFSTLVCGRARRWVLLFAVAPKVLKVIGYVLSIKWKAHGPFFAIKTMIRYLVRSSPISTKFSGAAYVRFSDATFYDLLNVMDQGTSTLPV